MKFKKEPFSIEYGANTNCDILKDTESIYTNDENLKPDWVEIPAVYTEFLVKRNKQELLLMIGESWTYGETLPGIATAIKKYNIMTQLSFGVAARMAVTLDTDLYQYAVPGNCNFYMFTELERILNYVSTLGYKKIYVCMQMTEPAREQSLIVKLKEHNHPLQYLINTDKSIILKKITFNDWLKNYDDIFFDQYENIISKYDNLDCILWKNFCKINTDKINRKFKIIDTTWIEYSSRILSNRINSPSFYSVGWLDTIIKEYAHVEFNQKELIAEMDLIEKSNAFIKANFLHSHHPNQFGHLLWSQFLLRQAGWVNDI